MTKKIYRSIILTSMSVLLVSLILITGFIFDLFEGQLINELKIEAKYIAYTIENEGLNFFDSFKDEDKRITLISQDGTVIADTAANADSLDNHLNRSEIQSAIKKGSGTSIRYSNTMTEKTIYYASVLSDGSILRVSAKQYTIITILLGLLQPLILIIVLALILSFFMSSKISKSIINPINSINLDDPENNNTYDELTPFLSKIAAQQKTISKQLEEAYQMQKEFKLITDNMNEGFLVIDNKTNLLSYNSAALKLLKSEDAKGSSVLTLNRTHDFRNVVDTVLSGKRIQSNMQCESLTYNLIANPVTNKGNVIGAVIIIIDITENAEREALRREFTANVSHELKTPLTSISGFAELMKEGGTPPETVIDFSKSIYDESQRLISLVNDIIKISELDEKNIDYTKDSVDLYELSKEIINRLKPEAEKKKITIKLHGNNATVFGVRKILDEMIYNICDNAIKYNKENGTVDVSVTSSENKIIFSVQDSGIGIPFSEQNRIFERFYRVDKGRSKAVGGTGLGLSIVKHGAIYHNAEISLDSKLDEGTTVTVTFHS
ncbi:MAG: ATP-binding protein [Clostridia bacterium]|nr:ATP-binding protein [Clostridia bacterium]